MMLTSDGPGKLDLNAGLCRQLPALMAFYASVQGVQLCREAGLSVPPCLADAINVL